jgi:hypothetical protein
MKTDSCVLFGVQSGIPPIGLGVLMILFAFVPLVMPGLLPLPFPIELVFIGFGIFLIWLGFTH